MSVNKVFSLFCAVTAVVLTGCGTPCPSGTSTNPEGRCVPASSAADGGQLGDAGVTMDPDATQDAAAGDDAGIEEPPVECMADADCDDGDACDGTETCTDSVCTDGTAPGDGAECDLGGASGICLTGECAAAGCGNEFVESGEDCDDGNTDDADGCTNDCSFTCTRDADCDNDDVCDGSERCDVSTHTCTVGTTLDCDDHDPCTDDRCDAGAGCGHDFIDMDGDGVSPYECTTSGLLGGDCEDREADVFPGQTETFVGGYCDGGGSLCLPVDRNHDYNCDGYEVPGIYRTGAVTCTDGIRTCDGTSWVGGIPSCGMSASANVCEFNTFGDCYSRRRSVAQPCR